MTNQPPNDKPQKVLHYASPMNASDKSDLAPPHSQFGHGFLLAMTVCFVDFLLIGMVHLEGRIVIFLSCVLMIGVSIAVQVRLGWRSFIPGVLLGIGLTCLVPYATMWVICGMGRPLIH